MNLVRGTWLPIRRKSGLLDTVAPSQVTDAYDTDPIIALDWPRPDLRIATLEILTGMLTTFCPPTDANAWLDRWLDPPGPAILAAAFAPYAHAFDLDGPGPRFMQDFEDLASPPEPIERLLIDKAGESTIKRNTDLLNRRGHVTGLGRPAAAIVLYTFQSWAPAGGAGNRTGLRGGGPMSTFVLPGAEPTLWQTIWANVPEGQPADPGDLTKVFPWLAPTIGSAAERRVTPESAHPLQAWWGMPRRIRLDIQECAAPVACDLTGRPDTVRVTGWRQRPHGANYDKWGDIHPLTPRYRVKPMAEILPLHPQPGGIGYRHWLGLVVGDNAGLRMPAQAVTTWRDFRAKDVHGRIAGTGDRILAAGYDMDNMKARGFVESEMPLPAIPDAEARVRVDELARALVQSADQVAGLLRRAVRDALFAPGATVNVGWELLSSVREQLWDATDSAFHDALSREATRPATQDGSVPERTRWLALLRATAFALFSAAAPLDADGATLPKSDEAIRRLLRARRNLGLALAGFGKDGAALFVTLGLPAAEPKAARKGRAA